MNCHRKFFNKRTHNKPRLNHTLSLTVLIYLLFINESHNFKPFFFSYTVGDETDSESVKLRIREANNEKPPPKPIQLKIQKNWKELVCRRVFILSWIGNYDQTTAVSDLIAGITLGLTMIPQAIAYAALAQLPSHYGLYAAFIGTFIFSSIQLKCASLLKPR